MDSVFAFLHSRLLDRSLVRWWIGVSESEPRYAKPAETFCATINQEKAITTNNASRYSSSTACLPPLGLLADNKDDERKTSG